MLQIAIAITGIVPYLLLMVGIWKGTVKQKFATWVLWLMLDVIVLSGIILQHKDPLLFSVFASGTFLVTIFLLIKKQFSWSKFETFVSVLVAICCTVYLLSGSYWAIIASTAALNIAGIPQLIQTYQKPHTASPVAYGLFAISSGLAVIAADEWSVPGRLPQMSSLVYCSLIVLLSFRKLKTTHETALA